MNIINGNNIYPQFFKSNMFYIKNIIETPYEPVLSIIQETMKVLNLASTVHSKLFSELQWVIKIIKNYLLYSYEIKEKTYVAELSKNDPDFKQFVDFVTEYNQQVIRMNKKNNYITNELLQKPSFKLKRNNFNQKIYIQSKRANSNDLNSNQKEKISINCLKKVIIQPYINNNTNINSLKLNSNDNRIYNNQYKNHNNSNLLASIIYKNNIMNNKNKSNFGLFNNYNSFNGNKLQNKSRNRQVTSFNIINPINANLSNDNDNTTTINYLNKINKFLNKNNNFKKLSNNDLIFEKKIKRNQISEIDSLDKFSYIYIDHLLKQYNYDTKRITQKDFNIFELKKIVGQSNVLPLIGRVILETFGLKDDKILNVNKLENFLNTISSQYIPTTL